MNVRRRIFGYLLTGWGVFCLCLFIAERVTGQVVLIRSVKLKLDDFLSCYVFSVPVQFPF